jgi:maltose O-acetyltransferase
MTIAGRFKMAKMGAYNRLRYYWLRARLKLNSGYHTDYLKKLGVKIGSSSAVLYPSYVDGRWPYLLEIGNHVTISINTTILTHDAATAFAGDMVKIGRVIIHDHCFIGADCTILCNVQIGPNSIVGAGSVVSGDIPPNSVYAGNPAKFICTVDEFMQKHRMCVKDRSFFKGAEFEHALINTEKKLMLKEGVKNNFGYICSQLPSREMN